MKSLNRYDHRMVIAPKWLKNFQCIAGNCTETCCQQWNIEVDPVHADIYTHLGDPEFQTIVDRLLHRYRIRRMGMSKSEMQYRFQLLDQPDHRCPLLNARGECRMQKKYGADILCDTCYFHPRTYWQIDEQIGLSACLSCPECARLALMDPKPTEFSQFEAEIDPGTEWLETLLIADPGVRFLMRNRQALIDLLCKILQDRSQAFQQRMYRAELFLTGIRNSNHLDEAAIQSAYKDACGITNLQEQQETTEAEMQLYLDVFDPISDVQEKPVQKIAEFTRSMAGGKDGFARLLAENYREGSRIMAPFFSNNEHLIENFMVHCVFSDSFKQFHRCQNEPLTVHDLMRHESALLRISFLLIKVQMAQTAFINQCMTEDLFLQTVIRADKSYWHYPDWFARCADRGAEIFSNNQFTA